MLSTARLLLVPWLTTCLITTAWNDVYASERGQAKREDVGSSAARDAGDGDGTIWRAALELVPSQSPSLVRTRQTVASTNEPNFLVGIAAAAAVVGGVAMLAYGTTQSCQRNHPTGSTCDRTKVLGAVAMAGGSVTLIVWALSR